MQICSVANVRMLQIIHQNVAFAYTTVTVTNLPMAKIILIVLVTTDLQNDTGAQVIQRSLRSPGRERLVSGQRRTHLQNRLVLS